MKTQKLIPLLDYVLEQTGKIKPGCDYTNDQILIRISKYAIFLSQPLKLSQFVPCDSNEVPLEDPLHDDLYNQQFLDAEKKVLFEGWNFDEKTKSVYDSNFNYIYFDKPNTKYYDGKDTFVLLKIEDLVNKCLTLTEKAVKTING